MPLTDDDLLDFDRFWLADYDEDRVRRLLVDQPDLFRNHLTIARIVSGWAERAKDRSHPAGDHEAYVNALRQVAAHLRQGDWVPGAAWYEKEVAA